MHYDFTTVFDRHGKDAIAIDSLGNAGSPGAPKDDFDPIAMWVADMNFATAPAVTQAIVKRLEHPIFGYFSPTDEYYNAICHWHERRNAVANLKPEHILYSNGVLGGVLSALNVFCVRGDNVLVHSPTYTGFTHSLHNCGYHIVHSPLKQDSENIWRMDFADMEQKITENKIHAAILCSPHNPCGRVWERWELEKAMEIFRKHDVFVVSDEIWSDIILGNHKHIPTQSVSADAAQRTVAMYAPSKTFNLAGLVGSYSIIYNPRLKDQIEKENSKSHYNAMNVLSMHALLGAYSEEGAQWVGELRQVLTENAAFACRFIREHWDGVSVSDPQGTYMLFADCGKWCARHEKSLEEVLKACNDVGVAVQSGRPFHGQWHIRMNLASPLSQIQEAFRRMDRYVFNEK